MKPALKPKRRYCVVEADAEMAEVEEEIKRCVHLFIGALGAAKADVRFLRECWSRPYGVVRLSHTMVPHFKASLGFSSLVFHVPLTTGMIKKAKNFIKAGKG